MSLRLDGKANAFVVPGRWVRGTSGLELDRTPLTAVQEGLALLKRGSQVTKHGRSGRPHATRWRGRALAPRSPCLSTQLSSDPGPCDAQ